MTDSSVTAHATVMGSSTAERVINCPGSVSRVARSPRQPTSEAAAKGTAQHAVIEHILINGGAPADFLGTESAGVTITEEMVENLGFALQSAELLLEPYDGYQFIEQRVTHTPELVFGTGDVVAISKDGKRALFADHKFGYVEVEPHNYQNKFIAAVGLRDDAIIGYDADGPYALTELLADVEEFELAIIQPAFDPAHTTRVVSREEIETFIHTIDLALTQSASPDAPLQIGKWCGYCPAKLTCEAWLERHNDLIDILKHGEAWAHKNIAAILDAGHDFLPLYEAAKERARHELDNARKVPGWMLGTPKSRQSWNDDLSTPNILASLRGLGLGDDKIVKPITPAAAKKLVGKDPDDLKALDELITISKDAAPLVRDKDPSKAPATPAAAFARAAQTAQHGASKVPSKRGNTVDTTTEAQPARPAATTAAPRRRGTS